MDKIANRIDSYANFTISIAGVSMGFIHALYGNYSGSIAQLVASVLLVSGLPFLVATWSTCKRYSRAKLDFSSWRKIQRVVGVNFRVGVCLSLLGFLTFLYAWNPLFSICGVLSISLAARFSPVFKDHIHKIKRCQNIKKIRGEVRANK